MAPEVRKVADQLVNGTITSRQFTTGTGHLNAAMQGQAKSWLTQYKNATGFSAALKSGGNDTQTYMEALKRATGTTDGMAVALQVTGEHAMATNEAIRDIAAAAPEAGGNIKGWSEVQGNFNQQLSQVVAGIKSWVIELGQKLLPAATELLKFLMDAGHWMGDHATLMKTIGEVILGAAAALLIYKTAMGAAEIATTAWKFALRAAAVAQGELNISELANPIGLIVVAIAGLVAGLIYAYTHFEGFRNVVNDVWEAMKLAFRWVETAGVNTWHALTAAFDWVKNIAMDVAHWFAGPFANFFTTGFNDVKNIATTVMNFFKEWGTTILAVVAPFIGLPILIAQHWDQIVAFFHDLWDKITSAVSTGIDNTVSFVEKLPQRLDGQVSRQASLPPGTTPTPSSPGYPPASSLPWSASVSS